MYGLAKQRPPQAMRKAHSMQSWRFRNNAYTVPRDNVLPVCLRLRGSMRACTTQGPADRLAVICSAQPKEKLSLAPYRHAEMVNIGEHTPNYSTSAQAINLLEGCRPTPWGSASVLVGLSLREVTSSSWSGTSSIGT